MRSARGARREMLHYRISPPPKLPRKSVGSTHCFNWCRWKTWLPSISKDKLYSHFASVIPRGNTAALSVFLNDFRHSSISRDGRLLRKLLSIRWSDLWDKLTVKACPFVPCQQINCLCTCMYIQYCTVLLLLYLSYAYWPAAMLSMSEQVSLSHFWLNSFFGLFVVFFLV